MSSSVVSSFISWVYFGSKIVGGLLVGLTIVLYANQDKLLYIPNPPGFPKTPKENPFGFTSPGEWTTDGRQISSRSAADAISFEEHYVTTKDGKKIHLWLMYHADSHNRPTLLYFHGNAGNMGFRLKNAAEMFSHVGMNILMMDYRGYGSSEGEPNEEGLNLDADAVLLFATQHPRLTNSRIIAFGRSLGGAVSVSLAHRHPQLVAGLVLENSFLSVSAMVDVLMPFLSKLKGLVLRIKWDSGDKIRGLTQPILFISGDSDQLVPPQHMKRLFELAGASRGKVFYSVQGGTHNDTWEVAGKEYFRKMKQFLESSGLIAKAVGGDSNTCEAMSVDVSGAEGAAEGASSGGMGPGSNSDEEGVEDPDYLMVRSRRSGASAAIPTMGSNFQVK